jgi:hypothetical protein
MSNQVVPLGYANTFGDWVVTTNKILAETNDIGANNYIKDSGTFTINSSGTGLLVKNDAIVQGVFTVAGAGSSATVQNDLTVGRQLYLSNTGTSLLANGTANILGNLLVGGMIMPTYGNGSNGISFLGGTTGDSANIKYYATSGDARVLYIQVTNDTNDDIYLDASGRVVIPNGRDSTSTSTGALVVTGGMGVGGDIYVGGTMKVQSTAEIQLGGFVNVSNSMLVTGNVEIGKRLTVGGPAFFSNTDQSTNATTGAIVTAGGIGVAKNISVDGTIQANSGSSYGISFKPNPGGGSGDTATIKYFPVTGEQSVLEIAVNNDTEDSINLSSTGPVNVTNATDATTASLGALRVAGGLGVVKRIYSNGSISTDSFLNTGANATIFSLTDSSSVATGALVVGGGVGIGKNLNVGGDLNVTGLIKNNFFEYTPGTSSPTPADIKSNSIHGFNAYSSTDFPGTYYTGWTVKGSTVGAQMAVYWNVEEVGSATKVYVRANDDTGSTAAWSTWERILTESNTTIPSLSANKPVFTDANKALTSSGTVPTNQGGTGLSSFISGGVVYASSTSALATGSGLTYNGTDLTCGGNVTAYSDARLKKNVKVIENALEKVQDLNGYTFERTDIDVGRQTGVIAQEVMCVLPEAVSMSEDGKYTVAYGNMVGLLIESIKELNSQVTTLKAELEKLKNPS